MIAPASHSADTVPARTPVTPRRPHVSVCICTYRRPALLQRLLAALSEQRTDGRFTYSIVVADNDPLQSGRPVATSFATESGTNLRTVYCTEPEPNIALARNRAVGSAEGDYIAFLDDDEFPVPEWLGHMLDTCERHGAAGVLGPVRPYFDTPPPQWVVLGGFCTRPEHETGTVMHWSKCRTGNLLFRRELIAGMDEPFRRQFGQGGEDVDFFARMATQGAVFVWCNEAPAYEVVPPSRCTRRYMLQRALLRGRSTLRLRRGRTKALAKSLVAIPAYTLLLPAALVFGHHVFMRFCIRLCDHLGRMLAVFFLDHVTPRPGPATPC